MAQSVYLLYLKKRVRPFGKPPYGGWYVEGYTRPFEEGEPWYEQIINNPSAFILPIYSQCVRGMDISANRNSVTAHVVIRDPSDRNIVYTRKCGLLCLYWFRAIFIMDLGDFIRFPSEGWFEVEINYLDENDVVRYYYVQTYEIVIENQIPGSGDFQDRECIFEVYCSGGFSDVDIWGGKVIKRIQYATIPIVADDEYPIEYYMECFSSLREAREAFWTDPLPREDLHFFLLVDELIDKHHARFYGFITCGAGLLVGERLKITLYTPRGYLPPDNVPIIPLPDIPAPQIPEVPPFPPIILPKIKRGAGADAILLGGRNYCENVGLFVTETLQIGHRPLLTDKQTIERQGVDLCDKNIPSDTQLVENWEDLHVCRGKILTLTCTKYQVIREEFYTKEYQIDELKITCQELSGLRENQLVGRSLVIERGWSRSIYELSLRFIVVGNDTEGNIYIKPIRYNRIYVKQGETLEEIFTKWNRFGVGSIVVIGGFVSLYRTPTFVQNRGGYLQPRFLRILGRMSKDTEIGVCIYESGGKEVIPFSPTNIIYCKFETISNRNIGIPSIGRSRCVAFMFEFVHTNSILIDDIFITFAEWGNEEEENRNI